MKGKNLQPRILYLASLFSRCDGEIKSFPEKQKFKRIQHHQTRFTTNAKGTSLGGKHKRRNRPTENKPKAIKNTVIGSYISIITLNVNGFNAPAKRHRLAEQMKHVHVCTSTYHITLLDNPPKLYIIILYC